MWKRMIFIGLMLVGVGAMSVRDARAPTSGGIKINLTGVKPGSLICDGSVTALQKEECPVPTSGDQGCFVSCTLHQIAGQCNCQNPGGGTGGVSHNFDPGATAIASVGPITDTVAEGFGKEPFDIIITEAQVMSGLASAGICEPPATPNEQWGIATGSCPEDGATSEPRNVCILETFNVTVSVTDTDPLSTTTKNYACTLDSMLTLADAPLCPSDFTTSPYSCQKL